MSYVGTPIDTRNTFQSLQGKRFNGDGSTTSFTLDVAPSSTLDIEVFVGNVRQDPNSAYTLSGTTLTFTGAPPSGTNNIYVVHQAKAVGTITPGANTVGVTELNLSDGSNGQAITTDGSGTLAFSSVDADADNYFATSGLSSKDLGTGLHIKTADSGASVDGSADELVIEGSGNSGLSILSGTSSIGGMVFGDSGSSGKGQVNYHHNGDYMYFVADGAEKMRIESGGTVEIKSGTSGLVQFIKFENAAGDTTYGIVGAEGANNAVIGSGDTGLKIDAANDIIRPYTITGSGGRDDAIDLGSSSHRFDDVFATNGTIQTSDKNQKNTITATDLGLAFVDKLTPVSYKFNNKTRTHYGLIAQDVETVLGDISKSTADFAGFIKTDVSKDNKDDLDKVTKLIDDNVDPSTGEAYTSDKLKTLQDRKTEIENKNDIVYGLRYQEFISPIIKAIQELSARVKTLEE
jgi:hypothetical protein